jgi:hypothetical protein
MRICLGQILIPHFMTLVHIKKAKLFEKNAKQLPQRGCNSKATSVFQPPIYAILGVYFS